MLEHEGRRTMPAARILDLASVLTILFLPLSCSKEPSAPSIPESSIVVDRFTISDPFGTVVDTHGGRIEMLVGEEATFYVDATVNGAPLPAGSRLTAVEAEFQGALDMQVNPNTLSFSIQARRAIAVDVSVTLDAPGLGSIESTEFHIVSAVAPSIRGVRITAGRGVRLEQQGEITSGALWIDTGASDLAELTFLDDTGQPIDNIGRYSQPILSLVAPVDGIAVEPAGEDGEFRIVADGEQSAQLTAQVVRASSVAYTSNPIPLEVVGFDTWRGLPAHHVPNGRIADLVSWNGFLVAAGPFDRVGDVLTNGIAAWNGSAWSALGVGVTGVVDLIGAGDDLLAVVPPSIHAWNGNSWRTIEMPPSGVGPWRDYERVVWVESELWVQNDLGVWRQENDGSWHLIADVGRPFAVHEGSLWAARFVPPGPGPDFGDDTTIERWDGAEWTETIRYTQGPDFSQDVVALVARDDRLFLLSGQCQGTACANQVHEWRNENWQAVASFWPYSVVDIERLWDRVVYATQNEVTFVLDSGSIPIGDVEGGFISAMTVHDDRVFIAGSFNEINGSTTGKLAYYRPRPAVRERTAQ